MADLRNAGGTEGGGGHFFLGVALAAAGAYMLTSRVVVTSGGYWGWHGYYGFGEPSFGMALVPFMLGVAMLFFNGRSSFGWLLLLAGLAIVLAAIVLNLHIFFHPTSLYETLGMLALLMAGTGMIARSVVDFARTTKGRA